MFANIRTIKLLIVLCAVPFLLSDGVFANQQEPDMLTSIQNNVFDWVFGDMEDDDMNKHELDEHFGYLRGGSNGDLTELIQKVGIKPEFLNFKAHDYDNNDKIDGLEMFTMIMHERASQSMNSENKNVMVTKIIDQLLREEDVNQDGYLDFMEYSNARRRLEIKS